MLLKIILIIFIIIAGILAYDIARMFVLFRKTIAIESRTTTFERILEGGMRILVFGDSTAVGTGSERSEDSTAGRLGSLYPDASVENLAENGMRIKGLLEILPDVNGKYDLILIQIGANDIIRLTPMEEIEKGIREILLQAKERGRKVIVLHSGNIGESKFFPWYVRPLLSKRSFEVREIYKKAAQEFGASYVDLIEIGIPENYYAADLLHLTGEGYGVWFDEIKK